MILLAIVASKDSKGSARNLTDIRVERLEPLMRAMSYHSQLRLDMEHLVYVLRRVVRRDTKSFLSSKPSTSPR